MVFKQILLAMDRTPKANKVFEQGIDIASQYKTHLCLVHCISSMNSTAIGAAVPPAGVGYPWSSGILPTAGPPVMAGHAMGATPQDNYDRLVKAVQEWLQQYQQKAHEAGCPDVRYKIRVGDAGDCICELAAELAADLVVVGRRDRSGIEEFLLGSVSNDVVHNAPCSVLVTQT